MMKFITLVIFAILCSACAKDHHIPAANLRYTSVHIDEVGIMYRINYGSNMNLLDLYGRGMREGVASTLLNCALGEDQDFSVEHFIQFTAMGGIDVDASSRSGEKFNYSSHVFLEETDSHGSRAKMLSVKELNGLLAGREYVTCKVVVTAYGFKPYYSNALLIPAADLLREINKPRSK
ncbi:hypothetical protein [Pseudomonas prosekii]|uniref:hypothetical protein n=1 Tax=Pseudomonas prosekii TaxID=1148509 RepID=UPI003F75466C